MNAGRPKLLFISNELPPGPGGIGTHAYQVATRLASRCGWDARLAARQQYASKSEVVAFNRAASVPIVQLAEAKSRGAGLLLRARQLTELLLSERPNVCIVSGDSMIHTAALPLLLTRTPWLAIQHGTMPSGVTLAAKKLAFRMADAAVAVSHFTGKSLLELGVQPRRLEVIHNGAELERFKYAPNAKSTLCERYGISDDAPLLVTVGSVSPRKGQEIVLRAMPAILEQHPDAHYIAAGSHHTGVDSLRQLIEDSNIGGHAHLAGRTEDDEIVALCNRAQIFVMTSRHAGTSFEGFGIAVIEAALCGTPAVVSGGSGLAEAVVDGETGIVVPQNDPAATASAVCELLGSPARLAQLGERARERAETEFSWDRCAQQFDELLREVAKP